MQTATITLSDSSEIQLCRWTVPMALFEPAMTELAREVTARCRKEISTASEFNDISFGLRLGFFFSE